MWPREAMKRSWVLIGDVTEFLRREKSTQAALAAVVVGVMGVLYLPLMMMVIMVWEGWQIAMELFAGKRGDFSEQIPGAKGFPFIGETLAYRLNPDRFFRERFERYGNVFRSSVDFTDSFLRANQLVCVKQGPGVHLPAHGIRSLGYQGLYGSTKSRGWAPLEALRRIVLGDTTRIGGWEKHIQTVIQNSLRRLILEPSFSLADKANQLACEIIVVMFLGVEGLPLSLYVAMESYLTTSQLDPKLNAAARSRTQILGFLREALREAGITNRTVAVYSDTGSFPQDRESKNTMLRYVVEVACSVLPSEEVTEDNLLNLLFVFLVEDMYQTLCRRMRMVLLVALVNVRGGRTQALQYLEALEAVSLQLDSSSSTGLLGRDFTWSSAILSRNRRQMSNKSTRQENLDSFSPRRNQEDSLGGKAKEALINVWDNITWVLSNNDEGVDTRPTESTHRIDRGSLSSARKSVRKPEPGSHINRLREAGNSLVGSSLDMEEEHKDERTAPLSATAAKKAELMRSRDELRKAYISTITEMVSFASSHSGAPKLPTQLSVYHVEEKCVVQAEYRDESLGDNVPPVNRYYRLAPGDLLIVASLSPSKSHASKSSVDSSDNTEPEGSSRSMSATDMMSFNLMGDTVCAVLVHELVSRFQWNYEHKASVDAVDKNCRNGFCAIPNHALRVSNFCSREMAPSHMVKSALPLGQHDDVPQLQHTI